MISNQHAQLNHKREAFAMDRIRNFLSENNKNI